MGSNKIIITGETIQGMLEENSRLKTEVSRLKELNDTNLTGLTHELHIILDLMARNKQWERQAAEMWQQKYEKLEKDFNDLHLTTSCLYSLRNLLAIIHRDGGQYFGEHGLEKAIRDAEVKVTELHNKIAQGE